MEIFAVKHLPFHKIPQSVQCMEDCRKCPPFVMVKQSGNIFKQQIPRLSGFSQAGQFKEQRPPWISKSAPIPELTDRKKGSKVERKGAKENGNKEKNRNSAAAV